MATTGRDAGSAPADEVATALREADLVGLVSVASGDALAATGTLARVLSAAGTGFQASVVGPFAEANRRTDADVTLAIGRDDPAADLALSGPGAASGRAFAVADELGDGPDPTVALAGATVAGRIDERLVGSAERAGLERRPGVAVPTADLADGLAHSTLVHAPFSGDVDAARGALAALDLPRDATVGDLDEDARRRVASLVALAASEGAASERASTVVERALRPYDGGPFVTVGGYADVLDATARRRPGIGVTLALGAESVREAALSAWREHGKCAHEGVRTCETARYDGFVIARDDSMPVATVARLLVQFRAPEPVVLAVSDGEAAVRVDDEAASGDTAADVERARSALATAAEATDGESAETSAGARARFGGDADDLIATFREAR